MIFPRLINNIKDFPDFPRGERKRVEV